MPAIARHWRGGLAVVLMLFYVYFAMRQGFWPRGFFWDADVYARAAAELWAGQDPYRLEPHPFFPFVYHPFLLWLFAGLSLVLPGSPLIAAGVFLAAFWAGGEALRLARQRHEPAALLEPALVGATAKFGGLISFASANLTGLLHFLLLGLVLHSLRRTGRYLGWPGIIALALMCVVKPYFLVYFALVLLDRRDGLRAMALRIAAGVALAAAIWLLGFVIVPDQMNDYLRNVAALEAPGRKDIGFGGYWLFHHSMSRIEALAAHAILFGGIALFTLWFLWRRQSAGASPLTILGPAYLVLTLLNPRLKEYDLGPAMMAFGASLWASSRLARATLGVVLLLMTLFILWLINKYGL